MISSTHSGCQLQASANIFGPEFVRVTQAATSQVQFWDLLLNLDQIELTVLDHLLGP